ncbi:MAG: hypothetical protein BM557_07590 [Flavobacterium sp. MedPE-SWcel]|nr:MAG: hypothetical protein BM557_07590 [Flavobacterium sp. MedPE-SWcel]
MKDYILKLRTVLIPFIIINILNVALWLFLYWLFVLTFEIKIVEKYLLMIVLFGSHIPMYIWLWPRIKRLKIKKDKNDKVTSLYYFIT